MYQVNEVVLHCRTGVSKITGIVKAKFPGSEEKNYYALVPVNEKSGITIYVPVDDPTKIRNLVTPEEIDELIQRIPDEKTIWIEDDKERRVVYSKLLTDYNREDMVRLIKTIYLKRQELKTRKRRINYYEANVMDEAEKMLYGEFGYVLGIAPSQVPDYINRQLEKAGVASL